MIRTAPVTHARRALAFAAALALGCGGAATVGPDPSAQGVAIVVTPGSATVQANGSYAFAAAVTGSADTTVTWSVRGGGTVSGTGLYTAPGTPGVYEVVATSNADPGLSDSASVTVTTTPPPGGSMTTAHRTSGVAPLAVFFDAVDTSPSGTASPFTWRSNVFQPSDYEATQYTWDFGDPSSGTWAQTGKSKNSATGYTAAHVYESPGTYTVSLGITDSSGTVRTYSQTITVSAFSGTTYYVSAAGSDTANGTSTSSPFRTVDHAMTVALSTAGPVQVLFRRGDTFAVSGAYAIAKAGPGIIGAYGSGNRPVLNVAELGDTNVFSPRGAGADWRIMDLDMVGPSLTTATGPIGPPPDQQAVNMLVLRLRARTWNVGIGWGNWTSIYATPHDAMFVVDCDSPGNGAYGYYVGGRRLALLGNVGSDPGQTHVARVWQAHKAVISNNAFLRPGGQRHALKLHGPTQGDGEPETRWVSITDNRFEASDTSQWTVSMGPQNGTSNEPVSHLVYERNWHTATPTVTADIESSASNATIKNNVFVATGSQYYTGILYQRRGIEPVPTNVRILNNTFYKGDANSETYAFDIGSVVLNCTVRNNLLATQSGGTVALLRSSGGSGWVFDHNLATTSPAFTNAAGGVFTLTASSPAANTGATLPEVRLDYAWTARPAGSAYDVGAFESR